MTKPRTLPPSIYVTKNGVVLNINGNSFTDDEFDFFQKEEKLWADSQEVFSFTELMKIYPEAVVPARKALQARIKEYKEFIRDINDRRETYFNNVINPAPFKEQAQLIKETNNFFDNLHSEWEAKIKTAVFCLSHLDELEGKVEPRTTKGITDSDIERAKSMPITSLYEGKISKHGKRANGKCPFHKDDNPSLIFYLDQNSWYCYSCNTGGSVVDWVMKRNGCDFIRAIKILLNK